jgi:hypothetical protein
MSSQSQSVGTGVGTGQLESLEGGDELDFEDDSSDDDDEEAVQVADARADGDQTCGVKAKAALTTRIYKEKQKVILTKRTGSRVTSPLWNGGIFMMASLADDWNSAASQKKMSKRYPGLMKVQSTTCPAICTLCYQNALKSLRNCIFSTFKWNPTNLDVHMKGCHSKEEAPAAYFTKAEKMQAKIVKETGGRVTAAGSVSSFVSKNNPTDALEEVQMRMYRFLNSANVAVRQGVSEEFNCLLTYCVDNAIFLKSQTSNLKIGNQKYRSAQLKSFSQTIYVVSSCIKMTQQWLKKATGSDDIPFINVAHDVWESKEKEYLGVSIHFMLPFLGRSISFPIGLRRSHGHKSLEVVKEVWIMMNR